MEVSSSLFYCSSWELAFKGATGRNDSSEERVWNILLFTLCLSNSNRSSITTNTSPMCFGLTNPFLSSSSSFFPENNQSEQVHCHPHTSGLQLEIQQVLTNSVINLLHLVNLLFLSCFSSSKTALNICMQLLPLPIWLPVLLAG